MGAKRCSNEKIILWSRVNTPLDILPDISLESYSQTFNVLKELCYYHYKVVIEKNLFCDKGNFKDLEQLLFQGRVEIDSNYDWFNWFQTLFFKD